MARPPESAVAMLEVSKTTSFLLIDDEIQLDWMLRGPVGLIKNCARFE